MSSQDWLPLEAALRPEVRSRLAAGLSDWRARWFAQEVLELSVVRSARQVAGDGLEGAPWLFYSDRVAVSCAKRHARMLVEWVLDAGAEFLPDSDVDQQLLDRLAHDLLSELVEAVEGAIGVQSSRREPSTPVIEPFDQRGGIIFGVVTADGDRMVSIALPLPALIPLLKSSFPAARHAGPVTSRAEAVAETELRFDVKLGAVELPIGDLAALSVGDVLVLNRRVEDPADLLLRGGGAVALRGRLDPLQEQATLIVQPLEA